MKKSTRRSVLLIVAVIALMACGEITPTPTLTPEIKSPEEIVASAKPYTVFIEARFPGDREGSGTGIIFHEDGWIVTNAHVVEGASIIEVHVPGRAGALSAELFGVSPCDDLAVIKVPGADFPTAQFGNSNDLKQGEKVMVIGYPLGQPDLSVTEGIVSKLHVTLDQLQDLIQTSAPVNPGNSGGPLLNMKGEVVGIITVKVQYDQAGNPISGIAFAISSNFASADEKVPRLAQGVNINWIGLNTIPLKDIIDGGKGLLIIGVADNSPAESAGLKAGDTLLTMQGVSVNSMADLCGVLQKGDPELWYEVLLPDGSIVSSKGGTPAPSPKPTATPTTGLVFEDDFSDPTKYGWGERTTEGSEKRYENGKYVILIRDTNLASYSTPDLSFDDFVLEVEATQVEGPDDNDYGVLFRYVDGNNFYRFAISGDGYYTVLKQLDGEWEPLVKWTPSPHINRGQSTNHLRVMAEGSQFSFYVNGEHLTDVTDRSFPEGDIGLIVGSSDEAGVLIHFDNVRVWMEEGKVPAVTPTPGFTLVFEDDFSDPTCRWDEMSDADFEIGCQQNRYRFKVNKAGVTYTSLPTRRTAYTDFLLQVQVEQAEGPDQSLHGVVFRHQDSRHYYLFAIRGDGYYTILKNEDGLEFLMEWTQSDQINLGPGGNSLAVIAAGSQIVVFINNERVAQVVDDSFPTGGIGLAVGTFPDEPGAPLIYFDNVEVWELVE